MMMPRALFKRMGGFDEAYFLHCEDLDLCRRVRDAGWRVLLAGDIRVLHGKGSSKGQPNECLAALPQNQPIDHSTKYDGPKNDRKP